MTLTLERYGVMLRSTIFCLCGALGVVSADPAKVPLVLTLLLPALLACCVRLRSLHRPLPPTLLLVSDAAVVVLTGLSQPVLGGDVADAMVEAIVGISVITFQHEWATRPVVGFTLAALGAVVCALGDMFSSPAHGADAVHLARMLVEVGLSRGAHVIVRARARAADRSAATRAALRREAEVAAARRATEREHLATLHDTACATLLMVSQGDDQDWSWLPLRAARDLDALSAMPGFGTESIDLSVLLGCVPEGVGQARVQVKLLVTGPLAIPSGPGLAIFNGVREAVANVARHAGVREAELRAWTEDGAVVVELSDAGRGFAPESVPARRRGISASIVGRMKAVGGSASVASRPGAGTRVQWRWQERPPASPPTDGTRAAGLPGPPGARAQRAAVVRFIRGQLLQGARLAALLISLVAQFTVSLGQLTAHQDVYGPAWAQTSAFICLAAVAATGGAYLLRGRRIPPRVRGWSVGAVLAVSATGAFTLPPERLAGPEDWVFGLIGWHALFLLADLRVRVLAVFLGAHVGLNTLAMFVLGSPTVAESTGMGLSTVSTCGFQFSVGVLLMHLLHDGAPAAGSAAAREEELRTRERIHEGMQRDHKERYRALTATTVPLLAGLGHGVLSPHDDDVRLRCGVEAARMRRLFAESDAVADPLLNELRACVEVAEHQGVTVSLAIRGRRKEVPVEVRRDLIDPVAVVLGHTRTTARVTVVWTPRAVRVSVVGQDFADGRRTGDLVRAHHRASASKVALAKGAHRGSVWVETMWEAPITSGVDLT